MIWNHGASLGLIYPKDITASSVKCGKTNGNVPPGASRPELDSVGWWHQVFSESILPWVEVPPISRNDVKSSPAHCWIWTLRNSSSQISRNIFDAHIHKLWQNLSLVNATDSVQPKELVGYEVLGVKTYRCFQVSLVGPIESRGRVLEVLLKAHIESDWHS